MKKALFIVFYLLVTFMSVQANQLLVGITGLAAFQPTYFEGIAPGVCSTTEIDNLLLKNDLINAHADLYYIGIGLLSDCTLEYGYRIKGRALSVSPTLGFGVNLGPNNHYIYVPVSVILDLTNGSNLELQIWGQIRNYFDPDNEWYYWLGWKAAMDIIVRWSGWGLYVEPIVGGGGTETLIGLRVGIALQF